MIHRLLIFHIHLTAKLGPLPARKVGTDSFETIWYSADNENWIKLRLKYTATFGYTRPIVYGNGRFVIFVADGQMLYTE